jgi:conjugal transfer mating pair stabilization protein TraN
MTPHTLAPLVSLLLAATALPTHAQSLSEAFEQGSTLGRSGNATARSQINADTVQSNVPHYSSTPAQSAYFGSPGLSTPAAAAANACAQPGTHPTEGSGTQSGTGTNNRFATQACDAVDFSQTNATRRPNFSIAPNDSLLSGAKTITADPLAIAGNIAGTYSACTVQTTTTPDRFETALCHQVRTTETLTCDKVLIVTPVQTPGCVEGQFLTRVTADPCPGCLDYLVFDFTCGANNYRMHAFTLLKANGQLYMDLGTKYVPGTLDTVIPKTHGPYRIGGAYCYQTFYSQTCSGANCTIGAWFNNPCQGTSYQGENTFAMPTTVSFTDTWDNQCAALDARTP